MTSYVIFMASYDATNIYIIHLNIYPSATSFSSLTLFVVKTGIRPANVLSFSSSDMIRFHNDDWVFAIVRVGQGTSGKTGETTEEELREDISAWSVDGAL